jgi:hypothetical protein
MVEKFDFSKIENREEAKWKRMPITIEINGIKKNIWVSYIVEAVELEGFCKYCKRENQKGKIERVKGIKVETDNSLEIEQATEKINRLIEIVENKMFICNDCFGKDFIDQRKALYIRTLQEAQKELGIEVDKENQAREITSKYP